MAKAASTDSSIGLFPRTEPEAARKQSADSVATSTRKNLARYRSQEGAAPSKSLRVGEAPLRRRLNPAAELAAMTTVARVILNLHETITRN